MIGSFKQSEFDKSWVEISEMIDASNLSYKGNKRCAKMGLPSAVLKRNKFGKKSPNWCITYKKQTDVSFLH